MTSNDDNERHGPATRTGSLSSLPLPFPPFSFFRTTFVPTPTTPGPFDSFRLEPNFCLTACVQRCMLTRIVHFLEKWITGNIRLISGRSIRRRLAGEPKRSEKICGTALARRSYNHRVASIQLSSRLRNLRGIDNRRVILTTEPLRRYIRRRCSSRLVHNGNCFFLIGGSIFPASNKGKKKSSNEF